jgi:hypothetical protein
MTTQTPPLFADMSSEELAPIFPISMEKQLHPVGSAEFRRASEIVRSNIILLERIANRRGESVVKTAIQLVGAGLDKRIPTNENGHIIDSATYVEDIVTVPMDTESEMMLNEINTLEATGHIVDAFGADLEVTFKELDSKITQAQKADQARINADLNSKPGLESLVAADNSGLWSKE